MTFFEDAVLGAKEIGATVGKKTEVVIDVARLKVSAAEINKEIRKRYEALGRIVYESEKADNDIKGIIVECSKSIDALYSRLDDVKERAARLQEKRYCKGCGAMVDNKALFCSRCGEKLEPKQKKKQTPPATAPEAVITEDN